MATRCLGGVNHKFFVSTLHGHAVCVEPMTSLIKCSFKGFHQKFHTLFFLVDN